MDPKRCALPGCDEVIEDIPGRPARRYCTAAHRSAARQARRAAVQASQDQQLLATLPWLSESDAERGPSADPGTSEGAGPAARPAVPAQRRGPRTEGA
ncbi:MAG: hypothetical protein NTW05_12060, partial [Pseudonocardiales bacterium]|nr:hypothetical protein [Pseudonocardiales bacterium]